MLNMNYYLIKLSPSPMIYTILLFSFLNYLNNFSWLIDSYYMLFILLTFFFFYLLNNFFFMLYNENYFMGKYTSKKKNILSNGFLLFIMSELMIFISLFWSYIHNAFAPNIFMGNYWPPKGIMPANPTSMIIFGTAILLSSSFIIMVSHNSFTKNYKLKMMLYFFFCMFMGLIFIDMQILEMSNFMMKLNFNFNDSIFSSSFLFTTSLHASHVVLGMIGLIYSYMMLNYNMNNMIFFMNFEMSIWYWHFVDYIWIGVFTLFYYFNN